MPGEDAEERAADQHPVEVADHEIAVGELEVERRRRQHDAGQAADQEHGKEAHPKSIGDGEPDPAALHRRRAS